MDEAKCWPSLATLRAATEYGHSAFEGHWRYLYDRGFVGTRYGSAVKVVRTPAGAIKARATGITRRTRTRKVPESSTFKGTGIRYLTTPTEARDVQGPAGPPGASTRRSGPLPDRGTGTDTAPAAGADAPLSAPLEVASAAAAPDCGDPETDGGGLGNRAGSTPPAAPVAQAVKVERQPLPPLSEDEHGTGDKLDADTAAWLERQAAKAKTEDVENHGRCHGCGKMIYTDECCGVSYRDVGQLRPSADWNVGGD